MQRTDSLISEIVQLLSRQHDKMVLDALNCYGFFIEKKFESDDETYYHKGKYLFTFKMETNIDTCETTMAIYYPENSEKPKQMEQIEDQNKVFVGMSAYKSVGKYKEKK